MILFKHLLQMSKGLALLGLLFALGCVKANRQSPGELSEEINAYSTEKSLIPFNNRALFEVGQVELEDIQFSRVGEDSFRQVNQAQLFLRLCNIRDRGSQGTIRNEKFHVSSELGDQVAMTQEGKTRRQIGNPIVVNSANCLRWSQFIPVFDFLAPSVNIVLHYEFQPLNGSLGKIVKRVGFNPWDMYRRNSQARGFFDLSDYDRSEWHSGEWVTGQENVIAALKGELFESNAKLQLASLSVEAVERIRQSVSAFNQQPNLRGLSQDQRDQLLEVHRQIEESLRAQAGFQINMNMSAKPQIWMDDSTGVPHFYDVPTGRFRVHMNLVAVGATDESRRYLLNSNVSQLTGRGNAYVWEVGPTTNGQLLASVPLIMQNRSEFGRVELLIKVEPISEGLRRVKPFMAVYNLGDYNAWFRRQSAMPSFDEAGQPMTHVDYDGYLKSVEGYNAAVTSLRAQERFYLGPIVLRFVRVMPGETATDRTLQYRAESCIVQGLGGARVGRGLQFEVITEDQGRQHRMVRQTNENGCITWFGFLSHKYYRKEVLQKKQAIVRFLGNRTREGRNTGDDAIDDSSIQVNTFEKTFNYYMNPWDEKFTFGWDEPDMPEGYVEEIEQLQRNAPVSKLFIADFKYQTMGFRYKIDRFLKLKVKKAVLLQVYPYVLKYNSIVLGRQATERLRDGVYLMKVALHKYYLDPAAKGVRIYDENTRGPLSFAEQQARDNFLSNRPNYVDDFTRYFEEMDRENGATAVPRANDMYNELFGDPSAVLSQAQESEPRLQYAPGEGDGQPLTYRLLNEEELQESRKEYISTQTTLVRVLGGQIITPVEFEVEDLRLMRIRNQFLIELQSIDENKLRYATLIDQTLDEWNQSGDIEKRFADVFRELDTVEQIESEILQRQADSYQAARDRQEVERELADLGLQLAEARARLYEIFGLNQFAEGSAEYTKRLEEIQMRLTALQEYRDRVNGTGGEDYQNAFRNQKRRLINLLMQRLAQNTDADIDLQIQNAEPGSGQEAISRDPFLRFMFMNTSGTGGDALQDIYSYHRERAAERGDGSLVNALNEIQGVDFTENPLAPSFNFELLRNDGEHNPELAEDDGKSGLPKRTFIGPLTFVFNTNGSALRPTDILNEAFCSTALCEVPELISQGVPPAEVEQAAPLNESGSFYDFSGDGIYAMGDSVNADYENNRYYGYLRTYHNVTVDDLIQRRLEVQEVDTRRMEQGSQIINFTETFKLKYTLLNDNPRSRLKSINHRCAETVPIDRLEECFKDITSGPRIFPKNQLMTQLNKRELSFPDIAPYAAGQPVDNEAWYNVAGHEPIRDEDLLKVMEKGWKSSDVDQRMVRRLMHRMCFALAQNFFNENYLKKAVTKGERLTKAINLAAMNSRSLGGLESLCHRYVGRIYGYYGVGAASDNESAAYSNAFANREKAIPPVDVAFPPIILERKVRAYSTTDRYVYRGGKSLNINLSASFNLSSSNGIKVSTTANWKPWEWLTSTVGDAFRSIPIIGPVGANIAGAFGLTRSASRDESAGRTQGVNVTSGTFLVSQQATFDIELGEYERCLVVRFHPAFLRDFFDRSNFFANQTFLKKSFDDNTDIESQGILICSGNPSNRCLPVKEKYFYFTQHFTEGDMLDTADLHNHPWLLQLRGYRDFQVFTSMIGAREVDYIDDNRWLNDVVSRVTSDAVSMRLQGSHRDNAKPEFEIVDQESDINWPLDELSRTYFEVLPTFPGLYTYMDESGQNVSEWPYAQTDPGRSFQQCEP